MKKIHPEIQKQNEDSDLKKKELIESILEEKELLENTVFFVLDIEYDEERNNPGTSTFKKNKLLANSNKKTEIEDKAEISQSV